MAESSGKKGPGPPSRQQIKELEEKVRRQKYASDDLRAEIFALSNRGNHLASQLGFADLDEAETAVEARPEVYHRAFIEKSASQIQSLELQVAKHIQLGAESREALGEASLEIEELQKENSKLREELTAAHHEKARLESTLREWESKSTPVSRLVPSSTGLPTPSATIKKRALNDVTPRNATVPRVRRAGELPPSSPGPPSSPLPQRATFPDSNDSLLLSGELRDLQRKYDALRKAKECDDAKYQADYTKWRNFKRWMFDEQEASLSSIMMDGKTPNWKRVLKMRKHYLKNGPEVDTPGFGESSTRAQGDLASGTVTPPTNDRGVDASAVEDVVSPAKQHHSSLTARFLEARNSTIDSAAARRASPVETARERHLQSSPSKSSPSKRKSQKRKAVHPPSSETEEDSQAPAPVYGTQPGLRRIVVARADGGEQILVQPASPLARTTPEPLPARDLSARSSSTHSTPRSPQKRRTTPSSTPSTPRKDKENQDSPSKRKRRRQDYSAYKGRGRYAASTSTKPTTINALYEIDTEQNGGLKHQFNEVVRNKEQRKHMHAFDCECCREYYEAVGPLPARLQAPLWKSPQSTPSKRTARSGHKHLDAAASPSGKGKGKALSSEQLTSVDLDIDADEAEQEQAIAKHRQEISRHRQQWERPLTPPGYWEIGFPDTQETSAINEKAREMHERKRERVEVEASRGGRYRKR